jgi:hypothetical protein
MDEVTGYIGPIDDAFRARLAAHRFEQDIPATWTPEFVGERLIEAYRVLKQTPISTRPKGDTGYWPATLHLDPRDEWSHLTIEDQSQILAARRAHAMEGAKEDLPTKEQASRMNEALAWPMHFLGDKVRGRWKGKGSIMADALTLWASHTAHGKAPAAELNRRRLLAEGMAARRTLQGDELKALVRLVREECDEELAADLRLTKARASRIKARHKIRFRQLARPNPADMMPDEVITRSAMDKWRKRACEEIATALVRRRIPVR